MSASSELARLIATYRFLKDDLAGSGRAVGTGRSRHIAVALEETFLAIVRHRADNPAISVKQIEFLMSVLVDEAIDPRLRSLVHDEMLAHVYALAELAGAPARRSSPGADHGASRRSPGSA